MKQLLLFIFIWITATSGYSQITISANTTEGCTPLPVSIQVSSPDAGTISSYAWEITFPDNSVIFASSNSYTANLSQPGSYDISLTINGTTTETWNDYITVYDLPIADFTVDLNTGCFPLCVEFTDNSTAVDGALTAWNWDFADGNTGNGSQTTECYQNPGVYSPFLSVTDENGCFADISMPALIAVSDQFPAASFTPSSLLDCNAPVPIDFSNTSTGFSGLTSNWDFGDNETATSIGANDESHIFATTGTYNVCLQVVDEIGCENTDCHEVTIFDFADAEFSVSETTICQGQSISFQNETVNPPFEFQWDFDGDGTTDSNQENPSYLYPTEGTFEPELTIYYSDNCQDTQVFTDIEVLEQLFVDFETDTVVACSVPFDVNFTNISTGGGNLSFEWIINGVSQGNTTDLSYTFNDFGNYNITLIGSNDVGCEISEVKLNHIIITYPTIDYTIQESLCSDEDFEITNITVNSVDPVGTWEWDFDNDGTVDSNDAEPIYSFPTPGDYTVSLTFVTENGCVPLQSNDQDISIADPIVNTITISDTITCAENVITFCVENMVDDMTGIWNLGDDGGNVAVSGIDSCMEYHYQDTGYFDISLSLSIDGCTSELFFPQAVYIIGPVARFEPAFSCDDQLSVTFADNSIQAENLIWDFGDSTDLVYDEQNPIHTFPGNGTYTVTLTAINNTIGCEDVSEMEIIISDPNPNLVFSQTSGCPPFVVEVSSLIPNPYWNVDFGNGSTVEATLNDSQTGYDLTYVHDGITQLMYINGATANFWPDITYNDVGLYDVSISIVDENGCNANILYEDLIEVNSSPDFASFTMNVIEGCDSVLLNFIPDISGLLDPSWSFNNGTTSTENSPIVLYESPYPTNIEATFTASDSLGCISTVTDTFSMDFPSAPSFTLVNIPQCIGEELTINNTSTGNIISFSWDFGDPNSGAENTSTEENPTHAYSENGIYDVCLTTENSFGCFTTYCIEDAVTINNPVADFTFDANVTNCNYGVSFTNTSVGVINCSEWNFGDDQVGVGNLAFHTYSIGIYDVSLVVCNDFGCYDTLIQEDVLNFGDVVGPFTMTLDDAPCAPFTVDFEAYNVNDNTFDYFWDFANGFGDPGGNTTATHDYQTPGTYCPSLIMTDPNGCSALIECTEPFTVEEFTVTTSEISSLCIGDTLLYTVTGGDTYTWTDLTDITIIDDNNYYLHPTVTTNFTLNAALTDCETTEEFTIEVFELPIVSYTIQEDICHQADTFNLVGGLPNDMPGSYYVNGMPQLYFDPSWDANQMYDVMYEYTDTNNCTNFALDQIFINPLPIVSLEPFEIYCEYDALVILDGGLPLGGQFYDENDSIIVDLLPIDHVGNNNITYSYTDGNGCTNTDTENLLVAPNPTIDFTLGPACAEETLEIINTSSIVSGTIDSVAWTIDDVVVSSNFLIEPLLMNIPGDFVLGVTFISDYGCEIDSSTNVHVSINPIASFSFDDACQDTEVVFSNNSSSMEGVIVNQSWEINGIEVSQDDAYTHIFDNWGNYGVSLTVESESQCTNTMDDEVEIYPSAIVDFIFDNNCIEETSSFINQTVTPVTPQPTIVLDYEWDLGNGITSTEDFIVEYEYILPGTYEVSLHALTNQYCESTITKEITIHPLPNINILASETEICQGAEVTLSSDVTIDDPYVISNIYWKINGSVIGSEPEFDYTVTSSNNLVIELTAYSNEGCYNNLISNGLVIVHQTPVANFTFDPQGTTIIDPTITFEDLSVGATNWAYDFGDGNSTNQINPEHTYEEYGEYLAIQYVSNEFGCADTSSAIVEINPDLGIWVPNSFTPNEDGVNDLFIPIFYGFVVAEYNFQIFDIWGVKVFETNDPSEAWNGNFHNGEHFTKDGIYNWKMFVRMPEEPIIHGQSGSVTVLR